MVIGRVSGGEPERRLRCGIDLFLDDEGGYTTVAVAVALLVSLSLVFAAASAEWVMARSHEVQPVADAAAMAGENAVAAYVTIAKVLDASVLSMGLAGVLVLGAGLVLSCIPGASALGAKACEAGGRVLDARRDFSRSAAEGLQRLEALLPTVVVANSAACVSANSRPGGISYVGCAIPLPAQSQSDFSSLAADVSGEELEERAGELRTLAQEAAEARSHANDALRRGWEADCGSRPWCLRERAQSLAKLDEAANPDYPTELGWTFGAPLLRARAYYARRLAMEAPTGPSPEELSDSCARRAFYRHALAAVEGGSYVEHADGRVEAELPRLPHNIEETRACDLYSEASWPCTEEADGRVLHADLSCPGATGDGSGKASLRDLDEGLATSCETCQMTIGVLGRVASASTSTDNGFEHYWREVVEASEEYEGSRGRQADAEKRLKGAAEKGEGAFARAMDQLSVVRPRICPPGAWGCVAVVARADSKTVPTELTAAFLSSGELPPGAAVSAAALAPDEATAENNILATFFDGVLAQGEASALGGAVDGILTLWGRLLVGYGSSYESVSRAGGDFLDSIDGVFGSTTGAWLKERLRELVKAAGFEAVDMRLMKPVLVGSDAVLGKAGYENASKVRALIQSLPAETGTKDLARELGAWIIEDAELGRFTVAEITIPGTEISFPLTIDLTQVMAELARAA